MAIYRNVSTNFWSDAKVYDKFSPEDKYFMLYCLTNKFTNLCGCYEISKKQMVNDTGYNIETIDKLLERFEKQYDIVSYDNDTQELLIYNWHKYNWTKSNKLDKPLLQEIENIKAIKFKTYLAKIYNSRDTVSIPYQYPMDTTVTVTDTDNNISNTNNRDTINNNSNIYRPTVEDIKKYCEERGNNVDAQQFYDYYEVNDWKDSKGKPVKNWKQKLIANWEKNEKKQKTKAERLEESFERIRKEKENERKRNN